MIKLNNGCAVNIDEFIKWSANKQAQLTMPIEKRKAWVKKMKKAHDPSRSVITPQGTFDTVTSASKALNIEVDVLRKYLLNDAYPQYRYSIPLPKDECLRTDKVPYNGIFRKAIKTPLGIFKNTKEAALAHNFSADQIKWRIHSHLYPNFHRTNKNANDIKTDIKTNVIKKLYRRTVTPLGTFESKVQAMQAHNLTRSMFNKLLEYSPKEYYFLN